MELTLVNKRRTIKKTCLLTEWSLYFGWDSKSRETLKLNYFKINFIKMCIFSLPFKKKKYWMSFCFSPPLQSRYGAPDRGVRLYSSLPMRPNPDGKRLPSTGVRLISPSLPSTHTPNGLTHTYMSLLNHRASLWTSLSCTTRVPRHQMRKTYRVFAESYKYW